MCFTRGRKSIPWKVYWEQCTLCPFWSVNQLLQSILYPLSRSSLIHSVWWAIRGRRSSIIGRGTGSHWCSRRSSKTLSACVLWHFALKKLNIKGNKEIKNYKLANQYINTISKIKQLSKNPQNNISSQICSG